MRYIMSVEINAEPEDIPGIKEQLAQVCGLTKETIYVVKVNGEDDGNGQVR